jgi:hypothetical protein
MCLSKIILSVCFSLLVSITLNAQKIRRKNFGEYSGTIAPFELVIDTVSVNVAGAPIVIRFEKELHLFSQTIGDSQLTGTWEITKKTTAIIYLKVTFPGNIFEQYELYLTDKKMVRNGMYPQPNTQLMKH